ncbi:hypothetical protein SRABI106_04245 [Rahnella aquatilis]|nr:hypothetical protein SRABI106_04245 [Rahnella aquatilis]
MEQAQGKQCREIAARMHPVNAQRAATGHHQQYDFQRRQPHAAAAFQCQRQRRHTHGQHDKPADIKAPGLHFIIWHDH